MWGERSHRHAWRFPGFGGTFDGEEKPVDQNGFGALMRIDSVEEPRQAIDQLSSPMGALRDPLEPADDLDDLPMFFFQPLEPLFQPGCLPSKRSEVVVGFLSGKVVDHQPAEMLEQVLWVELRRNFGLPQQDAIALQSVESLSEVSLLLEEGGGSSEQARQRR